ncbi:MAG: glucuronate isomerase, partial [Clostridiales bacterium]|nr:glucuronate isomerase [Clostridiales bacterium]
HCHLDPSQIRYDKHFNSITEVWLGGDHYKWRAMRSLGIDEEYITGSASDKEKFQAWASVLPYLIGNPLYHWTHLELKRCFNIDKILCPETADEIFDETNEIIRGGDFSARSLIKMNNVKLICTTDDPVDSLEHHKAIAAENDMDAVVLPTFRPDKMLNIEADSFISYLKGIEASFGVTIKSVDDVKAFLKDRIDYFDAVGCKISDHAFEDIPYIKCTEKEANDALKNKLKGKSLSYAEISAYKTVIYQFLGKEYYERDWTMQYHIGAIRNNNPKMFGILGADTGFDSINDACIAKNLAGLLGSMSENLPKTILYTLNPKDNYVLGTMLGNFQQGPVASRLQFGSGWWFNDNRDGMTEQLKALGNLGILGKFVGMLTDSRSFLSYTRHEYFRRILCNLIGQWVEDGEYPNDKKYLEEIIRGISFENAHKYFGIKLK